MGLNNGYGVVIGTKSSYAHDPPDSFGRYYHGNLFVQAPDGVYKCAIDVDPKNMPDGIQRRAVKIRPSEFADIKALANGWHALSRESLRSGQDRADAIRCLCLKSLQNFDQSLRIAQMRQPATQPIQFVVQRLCARSDDPVAERQRGARAANDRRSRLPGMRLDRIPIICRRNSPPLSSASDSATASLADVPVRRSRHRFAR